ncbi:hypothetical protein BRADI_3g40770v3 [Brachypodium distachyon]|uniref:DUF1618 domain-containing protein n=1 Tax=Brachypodium distachyon TaxID=15368 RepID=A0A0Q3IEN9_BRADI|nr:hypothetical protein BRADI_3g40770v3 [Brachypodium distachyon]
MRRGKARTWAWWHTDAVIPYGDSLGYVDYSRGILLADVLSERPQLRYVRLPVTNIPVGDPDDRETGLRGCPERSRSVCVTDGGRTMKFFDVVTTAVLFPGGGCRPASSSFAIKVWRLRSDNKTWEKECTMEDIELWSLRGYTKVFWNSIENDGNMSSGNLPTQTAFMACDFSKYLLTTRKRKGPW